MIATEIVILVTSLVTCVTTVAASSCCAYISSRNHMYTIELLKSKKSELDDLVNGLKQMENGEAVVTPELACFLTKAEDYLTGVINTIVQIEKGVDDKCMSGLLPNLWAQKQARTCMEKTFVELNGLIGEGKHMSRKPVKGYKQPGEVAIVGKKRREAAEDIWKQLVVSGAEQAAGTICIHGAVGVGKTTIAKYIHNRALNGPTPFENVIWVALENGANLWKIQDEIAKRLGTNLSQMQTAISRNEEEEEDLVIRVPDGETRRRAEILKNALLQKGKFLLVLDSMRQPDLSLDDIGIPELVSARKLVVTCRTNTVCDRMGRALKFEMQGLPCADEAWELFKNEMGRFLPVQHLEEETISNTKTALLAELDGLPLAITELAQRFSNNQSQLNPAELNLEWRRRLDVMARKPFCYVERKGFQDIYENLEEATKPCFMYCALFPKNHIIESKELIEYWMWEGLLGEDFKTLQEAMERGTDKLNQLKNANLLQTQSGSGGEKLKMPNNLVRSMAIETMGKNACIRSGGILTSLPPPARYDEWSSEVERASFMENQLTDLKLKENIVCRSLSTLLLQDNPLDSGLHDQFFDTMPNLRLLDLSRTFISILPSSLSRLKELNALLLRSCPNLTKLPDLWHLQKLLVLDVSGSPIDRYPQGIQGMKKLRRLNLSHTRINDFPANVIGTQLKELEELLMIMADGGDCIWGSNELEVQWKGACIEDLLKLDNISVLELNFLNTQVFDAYVKKASKENKVPPKFRFCVGGFQSGGRHVVGDNSVTIIGSHRFTPPDTMSELQLIRCSEKMCVLELEKHRLRNLQVLYVSTLSGASYLFSLEIFQSLDKLTELHVRKCKQMVAVVKPNDGGNPATLNLPRLIKVVLFDLPKLNSICGNAELICHDPCSLDVSRCENLKRFHGLKINSKSAHISLEATNPDFQGPTSRTEITPSNEASFSCCANIYSRKADQLRMEHLKERKRALSDLIKGVEQKLVEAVAVATHDVPNFLKKADDCLTEVNGSIPEVEKGINVKCMSGLLPNLCAQKQARAHMERMLVKLYILIKEGGEMARKPVKGYKQPREVAIVGKKRRKVAEEILKLLAISVSVSIVAGHKEEDVKKTGKQPMVYVSDSEAPDHEIEEEIENQLLVSEATDHEGAAAAGAICIHGVLGVGKTSVAKYIHNKALEDAGAPFDYVIWVTVEYGAGLRQVQDDIANCLDIDLSLHSPAIADTVECRAGRLRNALLDRGRFLLVLDSVWQPLCLDEIGIPELVSGRKLIITSRIRSLFNKIDASKKIFEVQPLSNVNEAWELFKKEMGSFREDEVWELFKKKMGSYCEDERVSSIIKSVLLDQLDGLPLAIYELADTFLSDDIIQEDYAKLRFAWRKEVGCSSQPSFHMELRDTELSHRFKDSYENLDEVTRDCFLHATLLPKDNVIQSKELIEYWMWEGLLGDDFETLEEGIEKGRQILNQLKNAHLLESVTTQVSDHKVKMLNLFRSMATETMVDNAGDWAFIRSTTSHTHLPLEHEWPPEVKKASFTQNQISALLLKKRLKFNRLLTLLLQDNPLNFPCDQSFFYSMPNLKFLDMSRTYISALPKSLSSLKLLQILVLRSCTRLTSLPNLSNLRDLIVFDLSGTPLEYCPQGIENMKKLRRLDLSQTKLATFPAKVVGQLTELEELLMITDNGCVWGSSKHEQWEGACVEELVGLGKLAVLDLHFLDATAFDMYVNKAEKRANLPPKFCFCVGELQNGTSVGQSSVNIITLPNSTSELQLMVCDKKLKLEGRLRDLDVLDVSKCSGLEYLFSADVLGSLKNLRILKVRWCEKMENVVLPAAEDCSAKIFLPALTTMVFFALPNLDSVCCGQVLNCPRLSSVQVWGCDKLKLPMIIIGPHRSHIEIQGHASWFYSSSWDNPGDSNPLFQDTPHSNPNLRFVEAPVPPELKATASRLKRNRPQGEEEEEEEEEEGGSSSRITDLQQHTNSTRWKYFSMSNYIKYF